MYSVIATAVAGGLVEFIWAVACSHGESGRFAA